MFITAIRERNDKGYVFYQIMFRVNGFDVRRRLEDFQL